MKLSTILVGLGAAAGGVWAWMHFGGSARALAIGRTPPAGYTTTHFDANGFYYQYAQKQLNGRAVTPTFFVPTDPSKLGVWSFPS